MEKGDDATAATSAIDVASAWALFEAVDSSKSGTIEVDEWLSYLLPRGLTYQQLMAWWQLADTDGNGRIDRDEFGVLAKSCPAELARAFSTDAAPPLSSAARLQRLSFCWGESSVSMLSGEAEELPTDVEGQLCVQWGSELVVIGDVRLPTAAELAEQTVAAAASVTAKARPSSGKGAPPGVQRGKASQTSAAQTDRPLVSLAAPLGFKRRVRFVADLDDTPASEHTKAWHSANRLRSAVGLEWRGDGTEQAPLHVRALVVHGGAGPVAGVALRVAPTRWTVGPGVRLRLLSPDSAMPRCGTITSVSDDGLRLVCRVDNADVVAQELPAREEALRRAKAEASIEAAYAANQARLAVLNATGSTDGSALRPSDAAAAAAVPTAAVEAAAGRSARRPLDHPAESLPELAQRSAQRALDHAKALVSFEVTPVEVAHPTGLFGRSRRQLMRVKVGKAGALEVRAEAEVPLESAGYREGDQLLVFHQGALCAATVLAPLRTWRPPDGEHATCTRFRQQPGSQHASVLKQIAVEVAALVEAHDAAPIDAPEWHRRLKATLEQQCDLNPFNHCRQRFASLDAYHEAVRSYCTHVQAATSHLDDGITGNRMLTREQLMEIAISAQGVKARGYTDATSIKALAGPLLAPADSRASGCFHTQPVLLRAGPGTGKTWSSVQLVHELASRCTTVQTNGFPFVPALVYVQRLQRMLLEQPAELRLSARVLLQYFAREFAQHERKAEWLQMLAQAIECRALILVLDGIDEAASRKDAISLLIREELVPMGLRCVCTSRPEGVVEADFVKRFVLLDLKQLTHEQQREAISRQLEAYPAGKAFSAHLMAFVSIRKGHDALYQRLCPPALRRRLESFDVSDRFFHEGAAPRRRDPNMRMRNLHDRVASARPVGAEPASKTLRRLCKFFTPEVLGAVDDALRGAPVEREALRRAVDESVKAARSGFGVAPPKEMELAFKLALLVRKREAQHDELATARAQRPSAPADPAAVAFLERALALAPPRTAVELWPLIAARTDEVYESVEPLEYAFKRALAELSEKMEVGEEGLQFAPGLKDPVRVHEKAIDDYMAFFDDEHVAEANVVDVLRATIVCPTAEVMMRLLEQLEAGFDTRVGSGIARFELIRCKNKVRDLDPTHFRNVLNNLRFTVEGRTTFVELQLHERAIRGFNEEQHAHDHYNFFRSLLAGAYVTGLDEMLERALRFLEVISGVPVLLSLLVLILKHRRGGDPLPTDPYQLYETAILRSVETAVQGEEAHAVGVMLRKLALDNQVDLRRDATSAQLRRCLNAAEMGLWRKLLELEGGVPLIKTVIDPGEKDEGLFQFKHLSFQEALSAIAVVEEGRRTGGPLSWRPWESDERASQFIQLPFNLNMCRIGGGRLGGALGRARRSWHLHGRCAGDADPFVTLERSTEPLCALLEDNAAVEEVSLDGHSLPIPPLNGAKPAASVRFCGRDEARLEGFGRASCKVVAKLAADNSHLRHLEIAYTKEPLGTLVGVVLAAALRESRTLQSVGLSGTGLVELIRVPDDEVDEEVQYLDTIAAPGGNGVVTTVRHAGGRVRYKDTEATIAHERNATHLPLHDYTGLRALTDALKDSRALTSLSLASNQLHDYGAKMVATALIESALLYVDLSDNRITDDGASALRRAFESPECDAHTVSLLRNQFSSAQANALARTATARGLSLCGIRPDDTVFVGKLGRSDIRMFTSDLTLRPTLLDVDTRGSADPDDDGVDQLVATIRTTSNLRTFNRVDLKEMREAIVLPRATDQVPSLGRIEASVLSAVLPANTKLTSVDARGSLISGKVAQLLAEAVLSNSNVAECKPIQIHELRGNAVQHLAVPGEGVGQTELRVLASLLPFATSLQSIDVRNCDAGDAGLGAMGDALMQTPSSQLRYLQCDAFSLTEKVVGPLHLSGKRLGAGAITLLAALLKHIGGECTSLDVSGNQFGDGGACALATGLRGLPLKRLVAFGCGIDVAGAGALAAAVSFDIELRQTSDGSKAEAAEASVPRRVYRPADGVSPLEVPCLMSSSFGDAYERVLQIWEYRPLSDLQLDGGLPERAPRRGVDALHGDASAVLPPGYTAHLPVPQAKIAKALGRPHLPPVPKAAFSDEATQKRAAAVVNVEAARGRRKTRSRDRDATDATDATDVEPSQAYDEAFAAVVAQLARADPSTRCADTYTALDATVAAKSGRWLPAEEQADGVLPRGCEAKWGERVARVKDRVTLYTTSCPCSMQARACIAALQALLVTGLRVPHRVVDLAALPPERRMAAPPFVPAVRIGHTVFDVDALVGAAEADELVSQIEAAAADPTPPAAQQPRAPTESSEDVPAATVGFLSGRAPSACASPQDVQLTLAELVRARTNFATRHRVHTHLNPACLEAYLTDDAFESVFGEPKSTLLSRAANVATESGRQARDAVDAIKAVAGLAATQSPAALWSLRQRKPAQQ